MEILAKLMEMGSFDGADAAWRQRQAAASAYIEPALDAYFTRIGTGPTGRICNELCDTGGGPAKKVTQAVRC